MTWENLQLEVLEQFADPRWSGMQNATQLPTGVNNVTDGELWKVTTRKADDDFREKVLEVASTKFVWSARSLAAAAGDDTHGGAVACGRVLSSAPGWFTVRNTRVSDGRQWVNETKMLEWAGRQKNVRLGDAQNDTGVSARTIGKILRKHGWSSQTVTTVDVIWRKAV